MTINRMLVLVATVLFSQVPLAEPHDLTTIDRLIVKEPHYKTKPKYCLLVFGLEAKTRVWLVQDGDELFVDQGGKGDVASDARCVKVTNAGETFRHFAVGDLTVDGLTHTNFAVGQVQTSLQSLENDEEWKRVQKSGPEPWVWWMHINAQRDANDPRKLPNRIPHAINNDGAGHLLFADRPQDAPIIHINGPFTLALQNRNQRLIPGRESMLQTGVGPQGLGPGTFAFVPYKDLIPDDVYPEAEVTFPAKRWTKPQAMKYPLKQRC